MSRVKPRVREDLTIVELDGEAVIYDEQTEELHRLNPTATIILNLCDGTQTIVGLSEEIAGAFGLRAEEVESQVRTLIRQMRSSRLLEPTGKVRSAS